MSFDIFPHHLDSCVIQWDINVILLPLQEAESSLQLSMILLDLMSGQFG